jgi:predicted transcriptional regulator
MKVKKINIGIRTIRAALDGFARTAEAIENGKPVRKERGVYFVSFEAFRKALTPKRLLLLHVIREKNPSSINELARMANRDIKNVADDIKYLAQIGLVEKQSFNKGIKPAFLYDKISVEIAV